MNEICTSLISHIYDCVTAPESWDDTLCEINDQIGLHAAWLYVTDLTTNNVQLLKNICNDQQLLSIVPEIISYFDNIDEFMLGEPRHNSDEPSFFSCEPRSAESSRQPFGTLGSFGITDAILLPVLRTETKRSALWFQRHQSCGPLGNDEVQALRMLAPHLRRAINLNDLLERDRERLEQFEKLFGTIAVAIFIVDSTGRILEMNHAAKALTETSSAISTANGHLHFTSPASRSRLDAALASISNAQNGPSPHELVIPLNCDSEETIAHVTPLGSRLELALPTQTGVAAIFMTTARHILTRHLRGVAELFHLTAAECETLALLLRGLTVSEISSERHIALTTVKTHLAHIFAKTGTKRQSELVALATQFTLPLQFNSKV